ncbi:hypothetical protein AB1399_00330, partial [Hydrogenibacillus schlegelii]|uniref:hypothetical protein n=1 Tax=Hydrogenibacillus schlegelii TaxID=1484 RepID=UPI0034A01922
MVAVVRLPAPLRASCDHYRRRLSQLAAVREIEVRRRPVHRRRRRRERFWRRWRWRSRSGRFRSSSPPFT